MACEANFLKSLQGKPATVFLDAGSIPAISTKIKHRAHQTVRIAFERIRELIAKGVGKTAVFPLEEIIQNRGF